MSVAEVVADLAFSLHILQARGQTQVLLVVGQGLSIFTSPTVEVSQVRCNMKREMHRLHRRFTDITSLSSSSRWPTEGSRFALGVLELSCDGQVMKVVLQSSIVGAKRLVGHGEVTVRGGLGRPIVHLQRDLQLLSVVADSLVIHAHCMIGVSHVTVGPPLGGVIAQLLGEGQVSFVELQGCLILPLHLVYDA